ncbi:MAG: hypothetical protein KDC00_02245 [Flavobacteriales bacterium]|nr:hypothetical protein [Flavobacteriales bacterium]
MRSTLLSFFCAFASYLLTLGTTSAQCTVTNATGCVCATSGQTDCDLLPDMTISWKALEDYAGGPSEYPQNHATNPGRLRVTGSTPNIGHGALNVRGVDRNGYRWFLCGTDTISIYDPNSSIDYTNANCPDMKQLILQRIYHKNGATMTFNEHIAGTMTYHPSHGHNHVDDWATFTLRQEVAGEADPRNWPIVGTGAKVGFCLMDYYPCTSGSASGHCRTSQEYQGGTALNSSSNFPNYGHGGGSYNCSQVSQGISVGYTDVYSESLDGMWINIPPGTCNGDYWIVMLVDEQDHFLEENEDNNWTAIPVTLTQQVPAGGDFATVTPSGPTTACIGSGLSLTATLGSSYAWSNGETSRTITPASSGTYSCTVTGACGTDASDPVSVTFLNASEPTGTGATLTGPGQATLEATGANVHWFDSEFAGNEVGIGNQLITPVISSTTTYWAEDRAIQPGLTGFVGKSNNSEGGNYNTLDQYLIFDAYEAFVLKSVKVYSQSVGDRTFQVLGPDGSLVDQVTVNVPNGESRVDLDLDVPAGSEYRLKVTTAYIDMFRSNAGVSYPYTIAGLASITGSSAGGSYYYYCYDWEVTMPDLVCTSARVPVVAAVSAGVTVDIKAFLDGPYDPVAGLMHDSLRVAGLIPMTEPFSALGFTQVGGGGETMAAGMLTTTGSTAIVDWVLVELRDALSPSTIVATKGALIRRDGQVVSTTGAALGFGVPNGDYHVALRHRNHLGVMSAAPISLSAVAVDLDLSLSSTPTWGTEARKVNGAVRTLWSGETVRDGAVMYTGAGNDRDPVLSAIGGVVATDIQVGYLGSDINMDGIVKYTGVRNDRDPILVGIGGIVPTNVRQQQLP